MSFKNNHCEVTDSFYSVIYQCANCGKNCARHLMSQGLCKECLTGHLIKIEEEYVAS